MVLSVAIDLGTTRIKAARLTAEGGLAELRARSSPPVRGRGTVRESDPAEYLCRASDLLEQALAGLAPDTPVGIASQRSSFLVWDAHTGRPLSPLISWRDRRASRWCRENADLAADVQRVTGLPLSPHYMGPKLAVFLSRDRALLDRAREGSALVGTLDCYLVWQWTGGRVHRTDLTLAARTLLVDPRAGDWDDALLATFGVPRKALPAVSATTDRTDRLNPGGVLTASVADQAAAALAAVGHDPARALVNLGTGGFLVRPTGHRWAPLPGYLAGPLLSRPGRDCDYALEGTINGVASALARCPGPPVELEQQDRLPGSYCLPDVDGVGSPHWLAETPQLWSRTARVLRGPPRRRVLLEGIAFRVREILEGMGGKAPEVHLAGGLVADPFVPAALAACLGQAVHVTPECEATLLGAARLAAGLDPWIPTERRVVRPGAPGAYLASKYGHWRTWVGAELRREAAGDAPKTAPFGLAPGHRAR